MPRPASDKPLARGSRLRLTDLLVFSLVMMAANMLWKLFVHEDDAGVLWLWSMDVSAPFNALAGQTARAVYCLLHSFKPDLSLADGCLAFPNGNATHIGWSCTPVKQITIFACTVLLAPPLWERRSLHKLWYIPLCALLLYGINILRIALIVLAIEHHPDWFAVLHTYILKYAFYGIVFLLWTLWVVVFARRFAQSVTTS